MRSSTLFLLGVTAFAACSRKPNPGPVETTSLPPPAVTSVAPEAPNAAASSAEPAAQEVLPPDPGRIDLTFTGDVEQRLTGEGVKCDDGFWVRSSDVVGPGSKPRWVLLLADGAIQFQLGPFETSRVFDSPPEAAAGIMRTENGFELDVDLVEQKGKKGKTHVKGTIACSRQAVGIVPAAIAKLVGDEAGSPIRPFCTHDFGRAQTKACVSVVVAGKPQEKALDLVRRLRKRLPPGWLAFVGTTRWLGAEKLDGAVEVVVGPGRDAFDILRLAQSNAVNYDMSTEALVKKLRAYHAIVPLDIWHAETDTVQVDLAALPTDLAAFAKDVYEFCPDIVDQGVGSLPLLEKEIATTKRLYFWWD